MYFIGLDVHKKTISFCMKDAAGCVLKEGKIGATRQELYTWLWTLPKPRTFAMEATNFYRVDLRLPASPCRQGKGGAPSDAACHRCSQKEERQD